MYKIKLFSALFIVLVISSSCKTDDVKPFVTISSNMTSISEDSGEAIITASIAQPSNEDVLVTLATAGTATGDNFDYEINPAVIQIPAGSLQGISLLTAVQDNTLEGNEIIEISIQSVIGATSNQSQSLSIVIEDDDTPFQPQIIINEILYDPSNSGLLGDANGDGIYAQNEDEFIEFINLSSRSVNLEGYKIYDSDGLIAGVPRHIFPANTILTSGGCLVVFGGGTLTGTFGGAIVQKSSTGDLNLTNAADIITLTNAAGDIITTYDFSPFSDNPNESYTRNPDLTGDFVQHHIANANLLFSPGTKVDGTAFQ